MVVLVGRVGPVALGVDGDGAVLGAGALGHILGVGEGVAIGIGGGDLAGDRRVLVGGGAVVAGDRVVIAVLRVVELGRVVDRCDLDVHRGQGRAVLAVRHLHREAVSAVVVLGRGVGVGAVRVDDHGAVLRVAGLAVRQAVAVGVRARDPAGHGLVFLGDVRVVADLGRRVRRGLWLRVRRRDGRIARAGLRCGGGDQAAHTGAGSAVGEGLRRHHLDHAVHAQTLAERGAACAGQAGRGGGVGIAALDGPQHIVQRLPLGITRGGTLDGGPVALRCRLGRAGWRVGRSHVHRQPGLAGGIAHLDAGVGGGQDHIARREGISHPQDLGNIRACPHDLGWPLEAGNNTTGGMHGRLGHGGTSQNVTAL